MNKIRTSLSLLALALVTAASSNAWASTAANTQIVNTATLTFNGGKKDASVTVGVNLVAAAPTLVLNNGTGSYITTDNQALTDSLVLTSNANGPATYHVTVAMGSSGAQAVVNTTNPSVSDGNSGLGFDVVLGASVTTVGASNASGANTLVIPAPDAAHVTGSGTTLQVNGIGIGSVITFSSYTRNVTAIAVNADGTYTLTFDGTALGTPIAAGTPVYEQKTVNNITVKPGTVIQLGTAINVYAQANVTTGGVSGSTPSNWALNTWTSGSPKVDITKYVRNVTTASSNSTGSGATSFAINGAASTNYYTSGVTAKSGDVLEYVIRAGNNSGTDDITGAALSDAVPTSYVVLQYGAFGGSGADVFYSPAGDGTGSALALGTSAATNQAYTAATNSATTTLTVNVGTGAGVNTLGTIAKNSGTENFVMIVYRVKVN
ncbi:hypothetical protein L4X63_02580 [Geomonas sp. Red32]|uniref:hypothetical protein n=1 Tax=Geomonas sp. Red32 TaxID=2912856 RepID=UPI00202CD2E7|nr:hypothetical protein [Geomonas sp. Red32]MCM0080467.1 hypothetical protein [Geomonas sp. Red32]